MICAIARTGSNLLTDGLHATRRAGKPKQFFLPKFEGDYAAQKGLDAKEDFAGYVRGIVKESSTSNNVFGFKVMGWYLEKFIGRLRETGSFGSGSERELLDGAFPRLKFVQILRRNKLRQAISKAKALQSGLWKVQEGNAATAKPQFDEKLITRCMDDARKDELVWEEFFKRNSIEPLVVEYEDLCEDFAGTIQKVLRHLKVRLPAGEVPASPSTVRQSDELSREWEAQYLALHPASQQFVTA